MEKIGIYDEKQLHDDLVLILLRQGIKKDFGSFSMVEVKGKTFIARSRLGVLSLQGNGFAISAEELPTSSPVALEIMKLAMDLEEKHGTLF